MLCNHNTYMFPLGSLQEKNTNIKSMDDSSTYLEKRRKSIVIRILNTSIQALALPKIFFSYFGQVNVSFNSLPRGS